MSRSGTRRRNAWTRLRAVVRAGPLALILVAALGVVAPPARGDLPPDAKMHKLLQHRREIVRTSLRLDPPQQAAFDEVFRAYEEERELLGQERNGIADDFTRASLELNAADATSLTDRFLKLRRARVELDERFRPRFEAVLPPQKVLLLFQLNFILDAVVNYDLAGMVPLAQ